MYKAEVEDVKARLLDLAEDRKSFFKSDTDDCPDDDVFREDYAALIKAAELLDWLIAPVDEEDPPLVALLALEWLNRASEALQAAGFEEASKYLDCMYDL